MKSVYNALTTNDLDLIILKKSGKVEFQPKSKSFGANIENNARITKDYNAMITKDNMLKRNWKGDPSCYFCDREENSSHLFFSVCCP